MLVVLNEGPGIIINKLGDALMGEGEDGNSTLLDV